MSHSSLYLTPSSYRTFILTVYFTYRARQFSHCTLYRLEMNSQTTVWSQNAALWLGRKQRSVYWLKIEVHPIQPDLITNIHPLYCVYNYGISYSYLKVFLLLSLTPFVLVDMFRFSVTFKTITYEAVASSHKYHMCLEGEAYFEDSSTHIPNIYQL